MKKLFKARGIGLIGTMCLVMLVAFVFLVCPVIATANSTQDQENQVVKMLVTIHGELGTADKMMLESEIATPITRVSAVTTNQETECLNGTMGAYYILNQKNVALNTTRITFVQNKTAIPTVRTSYYASRAFRLRI